MLLSLLSDIWEYFPSACGGSELLSPQLSLEQEAKTHQIQVKLCSLRAKEGRYTFSVFLRFPLLYQGEEEEEKEVGGGAGVKSGAESHKSIY